MANPTISRVGHVYLDRRRPDLSPAVSYLLLRGTHFEQDADVTVTGTDGGVAETWSGIIQFVDNRGDNKAVAVIRMSYQGVATGGERTLSPVQCSISIVTAAGTLSNYDLGMIDIDPI